jgi:hypothetical protein
MLTFQYEKNYSPFPSCQKEPRLQPNRKKKEYKPNLHLKQFTITNGCLEKQTQTHLEMRCTWRLNLWGKRERFKPK